jgi:hypothetical protein
MNKIQRSFSTIGFPERRISTAAITSKIRIIFKILHIHILQIEKNFFLLTKATIPPIVGPI